MKLVSLYLIAYNLASAAGWAYVLLLALQCLAAGAPPAEAWAAFGTPLMIVQSTMGCEVLHALFGLVRSPVFVTAMQVASRLWVVWGATCWAAACQAHWSLYLMVVSWCLAEVPRYLFYTFQLMPALGCCPYPLFFARYSAFMVLYPTGITGELFQCWHSLPHWAGGAAPVWGRMLQVILVAYLPGSPFMILNMWANRKSAFKKRAALAGGGKQGAKAVSGLVWPVTKASTGERSSTETNRAIWAAASAAANPAAGAAAAKEKNWRYGYVKHVEAHVRCCLGSAAAAPLELAVPYGGKHGTPYYVHQDQRHDVLRGAGLIAQLDQWVACGVMEADCADALKQVAEHPEWLDLSNHYFVLLGAGSAMGPLPLLLSLGANIYAVDIDRPGVWAKLIGQARTKGRGSFTFPVRKSKLSGGGGGGPAKDLKTMTDAELAAVAGCDLLNETPEIASWLSSVVPQQRVTVGNYTYLDGALHVQLSLACDAILSKLAVTRPDLAAAFLCTPTDVHPVPKAAHAAMQANLGRAPWWQKALFQLGVTPLTPNALPAVQAADTGEAVHLVDGVVAAQGPNYMLAKRLQHWRATVLFRTGTHPVSSNVAPSTATASVVHNAQFAAAYGGMHHFAPMEVMYAETSNAVMGALLVHDVRNPNAPGNPKAKKKGGKEGGGGGLFPAQANPLRIFESGAFHGGTWRCGFKMGTIGELSALAFYLSGPNGALAAAAAAGLVAVATWVATGTVGGVGGLVL